jgi:hypothetical protein
MRAFADRRQALEWVGVKGPDAAVTLHHATAMQPLTWTVPGETMIVGLHGRNLPCLASV